MKRTLRNLLLLIMAYNTISCEKKTVHLPVPIPPILKDVIFPNASDIYPGRDITIRGKGFSKEDVITLASGQENFEIPIKSVSEDHMVLPLPKESGGDYTVTVARAGLRTILNSKLSIPYVIPLENIVMPAGNVPQESTVTILAEGFEPGDVIQLLAEFYPKDSELLVTDTNVEGDRISFKLPMECYGVNQLVAIRGNRRTSLGELKIEVSIGDEIGGGVVFWVDETKTHGLICNRTNTGTATEQFGPSVALSGSAGTSKALGDGKNNTAKLIAKMIEFRSANAGWNDKKTAAELCHELVVRQGDYRYDDWFLPSQEELIELFKTRHLMASKGAVLPANNYWTSSEGDGNAAGWSAFYVNFYRSDETIVSSNSDKQAWRIGVRAVRSF